MHLSPDDAAHIGNKLDEIVLLGPGIEQALALDELHDEIGRIRYAKEIREEARRLRRGV